MAFDESANDIIREFVVAVRENTSAMYVYGKKLDESLVTLESQIAASEEKNDVVYMVENMATTIDTVPAMASAAPSVMNPIHLLFEFIGS